VEKTFSGGTMIDIFKKAKAEFKDELEQKLRQDAQADGIEYIDLLKFYQEAIENLLEEERKQ
jgi:hypothetical protein